MVEPVRCVDGAEVALLYLLCHASAEHEPPDESADPSD
jgi:hypothetical protein